MSNQQVRLIRLRELREITGMGSTWIYQKMRAGEFPQAVRLSKQAIAWRSDEIQEWIETRARTTEQ